MCLLLVLNFVCLGWCDWRTSFKEDISILGRIRRGGGEGCQAKKRLVLWRYLKWIPGDTFSGGFYGGGFGNLQAKL